MFRNNNKSLLILMVAAVLASGLQAAERSFYRYFNDKGVQVINDTLPPEVVSRGYDVISQSGMLIKRVPRQLTEAELQDNNSAEAQAARREYEARQLKAWDESLMLRYSSAKDIEAARDRALRDLQIRISILKSNRLQVKSEIEREQKKAADIERIGRDVSPELLDKIDVLRQEIEGIEDAIAVRNNEVEDLRAEYQRDIDRFETLLDRVKLRSQSREVSNKPRYK